MVPRGASRFAEADFPDARDLSQVFLTWELPIEDARVASALGIAFDVAADAARQDEEQVRGDGVRLGVRPDCGAWEPAG